MGVGLIRRRRRSRQHRLTLKVEVQQARIVTVEDTRCNPLCLVVTNGVFNRTKRFKNTSTPSWRQTLKLALPSKPSSEWLRVLLYDDVLRWQDNADNSLERGRYLYLGEARFSLLDLFRGEQGKYSSEKAAEWVPFYSGRTGYKAGEVLLAVSLVSSGSGPSTMAIFREWRSYLLDSLAARRIQRKQEIELLSEDQRHEDNGEEGDDDDDDNDNMLGYTSLSDSSPDDFTNYEDIIEHSMVSCYIEDDEEDEADTFGNDDWEYMDDLFYADDKSYGTDQQGAESKRYSQNNDSVESFAFVPEVSTTPFTEISESLNAKEKDSHSSDDTEGTEVMLFGRRKRNMRKARPRNNDFEISKKTHAMGVAFVEIVRILDLPPLRNKFSTTFDMDPFVIITFGRRVFKTSWKKHSLNPEYNEQAAFEVYPHEMSFKLDFRVLDRDSFSFHDRVADASVDFKDIISRKSNNGICHCDLEVPLNLKYSALTETHASRMYLKLSFFPYHILKKHFWDQVINAASTLQHFDVVQLTLLLDGLGHFTEQEVNNFFYHSGKSPWSKDTLPKEVIIRHLQEWKNSNAFRRVQKCPLCCQQVKATKALRHSKLNAENDLITHFAICSSGHKKQLKPSYVSSDFASKRWFSRLLIKLTYGKYALGSNNANILVQDRDTGIVIEEKISAYVKLGIRIIYNARGKQSKKFKSLLRSVTIKQGKKFDRPASAKDIEPFIKFHSLDMSECLETNFTTFNEFFYRKLKPGSRTPESPNPKVLLSPADSRCTVFATVRRSKEIWIKGRTFTLAKLTGGQFPDLCNERSCSVGIFRLAPQDYHRFHSPCNGVIGKPHYISGEYYTVNPMAVRTELDVFAENVRVVVPITSEEFGTLLYIPIGAMMVGSIILTCNPGDKVKRGQELGYFKFGGSTVLLVLQSKNIVLDTDLVKNSEENIETLVRVGMSIGHTPDIKEHRRTKVHVNDNEELERIKRTITVTEENAESTNYTSWEYQTLKKLNEKEPEFQGLLDILTE
ncbi:AaceriAAL131Cp [[Ashbya] aceris (nom. inval.)]|nr:AaceriAAL131Cp [[Ashbya] aceris (nom. inval.)]